MCTVITISDINTKPRIKVVSALQATFDPPAEFGSRVHRNKMSPRACRKTAPPLLWDVCGSFQASVQ